MTISRRVEPIIAKLPLFLWPKVACAVMVATMLVGCGHKNASGNTASVPAASPTAGDQPEAASGQPVYSPPSAPISVAAAPDGGVDLRSLNRTYIRWVVQTHQRPKTFEEFEAASGIVVPPAPTGKKYVIDHAGLVGIQNQ
jgi:hypothetical protein